MAIIQNLQNLRDSFLARTSLSAPPSPARRRMAVIQGDSLVEGQEYMRNFQRNLSGMLGSQLQHSDELLARIFIVSTTAHAAVEFQANTISTVPLKVVNPSGQSIQGTPLSYFISIKNSLIPKVLRDMFIFGRAYMLKERNRAGWSTGLRRLNPLDVREFVGEGTRIVTKYQVRFNGVTWEDVPFERIIHLPFYDPDPNGSGLSKFEVVWNQAGIELGASTFAAAFFINKAAPDGFVSFEEDLTDDEFEEARETWARTFKGARNAHNTAVLPGGARWHPITQDMQDLALADLRGVSREDISTALLVNPVLIGLKGVADPLSANSTFTATQIAHIRSVTLPILENSILGALNEQWAHTDFDRINYYTLVPDKPSIEILAEANLMKAETSQGLSDSGLITLGEARSIIGYEPDPRYFHRDPTQLLEAWTRGAMPLYRFLTWAGVDDVDETDQNFRVININGVLFPYDRLGDLAELNLTNKIRPEMGATGGPPPPDDGNPTPPGTSEPPESPEGSDSSNNATQESPSSSSETKNPPLEPSGDSEASETSETRSKRDAGALRMGISFAGHSMVKTAQKRFEKYLTESGQNVLWLSSEEWFVPLIESEDWTPNQLSALLRSVNTSSTGKFTLEVTGVQLVGSTFYLTLEDFDNRMRAMAAASKIDFEQQELSGSEPNVPGIPIALGDDRINIADFALDKFPIVVSNLSLYRGAESVFTWTLEGQPQHEIKEMRSWRKAVDNRGRDYPFKPYHVTDSRITQFVRWALSIEEIETAPVFEYAVGLIKGENMPVTIDPREGIVLDKAGEAAADALGYSSRSIQSYRRGLRANIRALWTGAISVGEFTDAMETTITRGYRGAWIEGIAAEGLNESELTQEELIIRDDLIIAEFDFVPTFAADITRTNKAAGGKLTPLLTRAELWVSRYNRIKFKAQLVAARNKKKMWVFDPTKEHCRDCKNLDGRVYRANIWLKYDIEPQSPFLECFGSNCGCSLQDTDAPITPGRPPALHGSLVRHEFEFDGDGTLGHDHSDGGNRVSLNLWQPRGRGNPGLAAVVYLGEDSILMALQESLRDMTTVGDQVNIQWVFPEDFHVTLVHSELVTDEQAIESAVRLGDVPDFVEMTAGPLTKFEREDSDVWVLEVSSDGLDQLHSKIYEDFVDHGLPVSELSRPENLKFHITMAYAVKNTPLPEFTDSVDLFGQAFNLTREDHYTFYPLGGLSKVPGVF